MFSVLRQYFHKIGMEHSTMELDIGGSIQSVLGIIIVLSSGFGANIWLIIYDYYTTKFVYLFGCFALIPSIIILTFNIQNHNKLFNLN